MFLICGAESLKRPYTGKATRASPGPQRPHPGDLSGDTSQARCNPWPSTWAAVCPSGAGVPHHSALAAAPVSARQRYVSLTSCDALAL